MAYKIDKKVPLPSTYPFDKLKVGESFYEDDLQMLNTLRVRATMYSQKNNVKLSVRKDGEGYRCYRLK